MPIAHDDARLAKCGFAKLEGDGVEAFVRKYEVLLGRSSKSSAVDIVLGDNMNISRNHAKISYNFEKGVFELVALGKNGVTVNGTLYTPSSPPQPLASRDILQIGDKVFYFLLPAKTAGTAPAGIKRSLAPSIRAAGGDKRSRGDMLESSDGAGAALQGAASTEQQQQQQQEQQQQEHEAQAQQQPAQASHQNFDQHVASSHHDHVAHGHPLALQNGSITNAGNGNASIGGVGDTAADVGGGEGS